jgi:hypothetical protein
MLLVVKRYSEVEDTMPYRVLPSLIAVRIEVFVDRSLVIRLLDFRMSRRLEVQVQVLGKIPTKRELTIPQELRTPGDRELLSSKILHVPFLQLMVEPLYIRIEGDVLW